MKMKNTKAPTLAGLHVVSQLTLHFPSIHQSLIQLPCKMIPLIDDSALMMLLGKERD
jgi:hypothetical protein